MSKLTLKTGIFDKPSGWIKTKLVDIANIGSGGTPSTSKKEYWDGDIAWINSGKLKDDLITESSRFITNEGLENSAAKLFPKNTVVIALTGATTSKVGYLTFPSTTNQSVTGILPNNYFIPKFIFYALINERQQILNQKIGSAQHHINKKIVENILIPFCPLNEQKRIVLKIEELFSELDNAKTILEKNKLQLKQYRQSILNAVVTGTIFGNDGKYEQIPLSKVTESLGQGWSPKCENSPSSNDEEWAVITTTSIQSMKFDDTQNKKLPNHLEPKIKLELKENDLLITRAGPRVRVGIACLVKKTRSRLLLCDKAYRIRFINKLINPSFFEIVLNSPHIIKKLDAMKTGTSDSGLNLTMKRFSNLIIPLPSLQQQHKIIAFIEQEFPLIQNTENITISMLSQLDLLRSSILKQAFEGKLVPQDPNDEPAEMLLQKIKKEKEQLKQKIPTKRRRKNVK